MRTLLALTLFLIAGCPKDEPSSIDTLKKSPPDAAPKTIASAPKVETPVPQGVKIDCAKMVDANGMSTKLGAFVELVDMSKGTVDATTVCAVKLAADQTTWPDLKAGDELCIIKIYCGFTFTPGELREKCAAEGEEVSRDLGDPTCAKLITDDKGNATGAYDRIVYTTLDDDTRCRFSSHPGIRVQDMGVTRACLTAAMEVVTSDALRNR